MTCFNCKSPDHFVKDCPEPNKMQQPQRNNRQNSSIESAIEALTQTLKSLLSNQNSHGYSKPKQPFHHNRANPHAKPSFKPTYRPHDNKGQYFKDNSKYQKQTAHTNAIEDYEPQHESLLPWTRGFNLLWSIWRSNKKLINPSQCKDFEELGGQHNSDPTFDNVHNSSISDCTDIKQTIDNSDIGDPNASKTETIDDNMQDQTSNTDNEDQDNSEFESTEIVHIGTKDDCSILIKIGERNYKALWVSGAGKCVISYDKYKTIPEKLKTQLFPSKILIKAANGSVIENKGECDITFKIALLDTHLHFWFQMSSHKM